MLKEAESAAERAAQHRRKKELPKNNQAMKQLGEEFKKICAEIIRGTHFKKNYTTKVYVDQEASSETFSELMSKKLYREACTLISRLEQTAVETTVTMFQELAFDMWETVEKALNGDQSLCVHLKSVADCLQWVKEESDHEDAQWSPKSWDNTLEELISKHIREQVLTHEYKRKAKMNLKRHLEILEGNTLRNINKNKSLLGDLFIVYLECLSVCMLQHLSSLAKEDLNYEESVLLYRWGIEEHWRQVFCLKESNAFDALFNKWLNDTASKIISTGKKTIYTARREMLEEEMKWNIQQEPGPECNFNGLLKEAMDVLKAVEDLGDKLVSDVRGVFLDEVLQFLKRYNTFLEAKVERSDSGKQLCVPLRIVKNCQILRNTLEDVGDTLRVKSTLYLEIINIIHEIEDRGIKLFSATLKLTFKKPFKNYFTDNIKFKDVLQELQNSIEHAGIQNNKIVIKTELCVIVGLYIQAFFNYSNKIEGTSKAEAFMNGSKPLQNFFQSLVSDEVKRKDPLQYIINILNSQDSKSLETTIAFFSNDHQDLREEHLNAILKIKGNISFTEKKRLVYFIKHRKSDHQEDKLFFFRDIKVKPFCPWCCVS
ncbi:exocyst complex component 3-like isoform X1 [Pelobates cultripes]|uniref:Exocyst complex component 3-like isoform X1 n=2 Tax=Pelobates cultripes TaxID=61616 RepID=A0AAD1TJS8_PELCU|nr:exocyst complex component 3-like isoform X1 [Pelobates cultripes]